MGGCASKPKELKRNNAETLPVEQLAPPKVEETTETVAVAVVEAETTTSTKDDEVKVESSDEAKVEEKSVEEEAPLVVEVLKPEEEEAPLVVEVLKPEEEEAPLVVEVLKPEEEVIVAAEAVLPGILVLPGEDIVFESPKEETVDVVETEKKKEES